MFTQLGNPGDGDGRRHSRHLDRSAEHLGLAVAARTRRAEQPARSSSAVLGHFRRSSAPARRESHARSTDPTSSSRLPCGGPCRDQLVDLIDNRVAAVIVAIARLDRAIPRGPSGGSNSPPMLLGQTVDRESRRQRSDSCWKDRRLDGDWRGAGIWSPSRARLRSCSVDRRYAHIEHRDFDLAAASGCARARSAPPGSRDQMHPRAGIDQRGGSAHPGTVGVTGHVDDP